MSNGYLNPELLPHVDLDFTVGGVETVSRPFYLVDVSVKHNISMSPNYYIGGTWPYYHRKVWYHSLSGGGALTLAGFFKETTDLNAVMDSLAISEQINPVWGSDPSVFVRQDIRIGPRLYKQCLCDGVSLRAQEMGGTGIVFGNISYVFATIEDYP